jgi:hypothetical protein
VCRRADGRGPDGVEWMIDLVRPIDCARDSFHWRLLVWRAFSLLGHRSYSTTSEEPPLSNFNSLGNFPRKDGLGVTCSPRPRAPRHRSESCR